MANATPPDRLQQHQIPDLPPKMFYIPNFINEDEEQRILEKVRPNNSIYSFCILAPSNAISDTRKPLDIPHPPPPSTNSCPTHRKQHSPRLVEDASLVDHSCSRTYTGSGHLQGRPSRHQPLSHQRIPARARHHAARRRRRILPGRGNCQSGRQSGT